MQTATEVSVDEYLSTSYQPDVDYVDGLLEERNVGEVPHGKCQLSLGSYLHARRKQFGITVSVETRVQVRPARFRCPDVCVVVGQMDERIIRQPPFLCVEILSPDDRVQDLQRKIDDYLEFGVPSVWIIDPDSRRAWMYSSEGVVEIKDGFLRTRGPDIAVPLAELFED
jgi:Uma2 family endonuclease